MANKIKKGDIVRVKEVYHLMGFPRLRYEVLRVYKTTSLLKPLNGGFNVIYYIAILEKEV